MAETIPHELVESIPDFDQLPRVDKWALLVLSGMDQNSALKTAGYKPGYIKSSGRYHALHNPRSEFNKTLAKYTDQAREAARSRAVVTAVKASIARDKSMDALNKLNGKALLDVMPRLAKTIQAAEEIAGLRTPQGSGVSITNITLGSLILGNVLNQTKIDQVGRPKVGSDRGEES